MKQREAFRAQSYPDAGGKYSIGYGFTTWKGQPVTPGMTITRAEADEELQRQVADTYAPIVDSVLTAPVTQEQYDALISLAWNHPLTAIAVAKKLNRGERVTLKDFTVSATVKGKPNQGLVNRRTQEFTPFQDRR